MKPTIHLTNASSRKLHHGTVFNVMAAPRRWEHFAGNVPLLTPDLKAPRWVQAGAITEAEYRRRIEDRVGRYLKYLAPTQLHARCGHCGHVMIADGDTLVCACAKAEAAAGHCHRAWVAPFLVRAGWRVVLDGVEVQG